MTDETKTEDYFVPNSVFGTRQDTATALTGAADEFGISQRAVRATQGGFWIDEALAEKVFNDVDESALNSDDVASNGDDGTATVNPEENPEVNAGDDDKSEQSDDQTPEGNQSSEEQTDKAPAKKSRSKK